MIVVAASGGLDAASYLHGVRSLARRFPGQETLRVDVGAHRLDLGPLWRVSQCTGLLVALSEFGDVEVTEDVA